MRAEEALAIQDAAAEAASTNSGSRISLPWFRLDIGSNSKIRFLSDFNGLSLWRHRRDTKPFTVTCPRNAEYGGPEAPCPDCEAGNKPFLEFFWPIYNYSTHTVELLAFKNTSFTPVAMLRVLDQENGTIMDRDFIIRRTPATVNSIRGARAVQASSYIAVPNAPSVFNAQALGLSVPTQEDLINRLRPFVPKEKTS